MHLSNQREKIEMLWNKYKEEKKDTEVFMKILDDLRMRIVALEQRQKDESETGANRSY